MVDYKVISSRRQAMEAWDKQTVIIREDEGYFFVYPMLGRGFKYPNFDLKRECCLNTFLSEDKAVDWADSMDYQYAILRERVM